MLRLIFLMLLNLSYSALANTNLGAATNPTNFAPVTNLLAQSVPQTSGLKLDLPSVAEDGSAVPLGIQFTGQLAPEDKLVSLHVFATANPKPELISFQFLSKQALPDFNTRIRLNESQTVIAVALSEQGHSWISSQTVRVTISGCFVRENQQITEIQMQNPRIALPKRIQANQPIELRTLITHPMETGLRSAPDGSLIPQNLVQNLQLSIDSQPALKVQFHNGTAANPYVRFLIQNSGSDLAFRWQDQQGAEIIEQRQLPL